MMIIPDISKDSNGDKDDDSDDKALVLEKHLESRQLVGRAQAAAQLTADAQIRNPVFVFDVFVIVFVFVFVSALADSDT